MAGNTVEGTQSMGGGIILVNSSSSGGCDLFDKLSAITGASLGQMSGELEDQEILDALDKLQKVTLRVNPFPESGDSIRGYNMEEAADNLLHKLSQADGVVSMKTVCEATRRVIEFAMQTANYLRGETISAQWSRNELSHMEVGRQLQIIGKALRIALEWNKFCPGSADCSPEIPGLVDSLDKKTSLRQHATGKSATSAEIATSSREDLQALLQRRLLDSKRA